MVHLCFGNFVSETKHKDMLDLDSEYCPLPPPHPTPPPASPPPPPLSHTHSCPDSMKTTGAAAFVPVTISTNSAQMAKYTLS